MVIQDLDYIFTTLDIECKDYIEWIELREFDESIYHDPLDIEQLEAAIETVCGPNSNGKCQREYFSDIANELERRHALEEKIRWDFRALDVDDVGRIPVESALFLFKAVHDNHFSQQYWETFINSRCTPNADVSFDEIKLYLCNIPPAATSQSDSEYLNMEQMWKDKSAQKNYDTFKELQGLLEDDAYTADLEREMLMLSNKLKNNADNLINRMDEIGLHALLEDDFGDSLGYERPKEKVTATELLDALHEKYQVLRDELLYQMLSNHIGEGMWQALPGNEQQEKLFQLKMKEEKLRKEGKLEAMVIHLPDARTPVDYNVFSLMGESTAELEKRILDQQKKIEESGLPMEEVVREFGKKLNDKEKMNSSNGAMLLDINNRFLFERDVLRKKLQGLSGYHALNASERENLLFSLVQARLRGVQESYFMSAAVSVGLCERLQPRNHDRSARDPEKASKLSTQRLEVFKNRGSLDGPVLPPKIYLLKSKLGRVDIALQFVQECERRYSLEREMLLSMLHSNEVLHHRISARKLSNDERYKQLSVLQAQWHGWHNKNPSEKISSLNQSKKCFEEAIALKFETVKEEMREELKCTVSDKETIVSLLTSLQMKQDEKCRSILNVGVMHIEELNKLWKEQTTAIIEQTYDHVAAVIFGIVELSEDEEELLKALEDKYDTLRDKLLMQYLLGQYGQAEWDRLSEQERQKELMKLKLEEKRLRKEGKYDELSKLLGNATENSALVNKLLGENRQRYMNKLNDRLRNRERRIDAGEDPDTFTEALEETSEISSGNTIEDLEQRFERERDALLRKLREEHNRQDRERERQGALMRLRLETRKAGRESNFNSAALVLGLAERNRAALEDRFKSDRERQEQLAKERLEARRRKKDSQPEELADKIEPSKDDLLGWQDFVLKELARKHEKERNLFSDVLQDEESEDLRQEAREMSPDHRQERLNQLKEKRAKLDLGIKNDQEEHLSILEMAISIKYIIREELFSEQGNDNIIPDDMIISLMADLQQWQDDEVRGIMEVLPKKSQEQLVQLHEKQCEEENQSHCENLCNLLFEYEGDVKDDDIMKALDKKYDVLLDKLALAALEEQLSDAEWKNLSEKERQAKIVKLKLEQKKLLQDGKFDEAARLLGEGFEIDASIKQLMGENKKRYNELLQERLRKRQERIANGETLNEIEDDELSEEVPAENEKVKANALLKDLQKRYDSEKEALLARLHGVDKQFMSEKERQAELTRLRHEQRKAEKAEKFDTAAMVLGLAERNKEAADTKFKNDRARQELIAKEKLERMRNRKSMKKVETKDVVEEVKEDTITHDCLMKVMEQRHAFEGEELINYLQNIDKDLQDQAALMTMGARNSHLERLNLSSKQTDDFRSIVNEMAAIKMVNRMETLHLDNNSTKENIDNVIVSIMADLQQKQDEEVEKIMRIQIDMTQDEISSLQRKEVESCRTKNFQQIPNVLSLPEEIKLADESAFVGALETKYDSLKDKLLMDALEKQMGDAIWAAMDEKQRQQKLMQIKLEKKKLEREGRHDEASRLINELLQQNDDIQSLLVSSKAEQDKRFKERLENRKKLKASGMSDEEIKLQEDEDEKIFEEKVAGRSTGNVLQDLEKNFEVEKEALLNMLKDSDSKYSSERRRQLELARLRREAKKVEAEGKFQTAALMLGMMKQHEAALDSKLKSDRLRQEQLARERLEARRNKKVSMQQEMSSEVLEESVEETNDLITLQGNVLKIMEQKHNVERDLLLSMVQDYDKNEWQKKAEMMSGINRQKQLLQLKQSRKLWREEQDDSVDQMKIFKEAIAMKVVEIMSRSNSSDSRDDAIVKILADLQESQDEEVEYTTKDLAEKDAVTLKQLIEVQQLALKQQWNDNVAAAVLDIKGSEVISEAGSIENELNDALNEKYDALKEKIYEEALKGKFGEEVWNAMSPKERNEHLSNMKANEDLKTGDEETHNDLAAVKLPGLDDNMDGKDADKVPGEEKNGNNILKELQKQMEDERDALMSTLINAQSKDLNEKERQLAIARLRRDKMRIKREEKYDSAAIILNMAKKDMSQKQANYQNDRARQEQLAKEKIAARRRRKKEIEEQKKSEYEKLKEEEMEDKKDALVTVQKVLREGTMALQEDLLNEMEKKHAGEQDVLMELVHGLSRDVIEESIKMEGDDRITKLNLISISRNKQKDKARANINSKPPDSDMNEAERITFNESISKGRSAQLKVLSDGLALAVVSKSEELGKTITDGKLDDQISISLMADLQELQNLENNALLKTLSESDQQMIQSLKDEQHKCRRAGYLENLATIIFRNVPKSKKERETVDAEIEEFKEEEKKLDEEALNQLAELEKEIEAEKKNKLLTMSGDDMERYMKELQKQEEAKRKAIHDQLAKQREIAKERLKAKQRKRDDKLYESEFVSAMIANSHKRTEMIREKTMAIQGAQKDSLEERLKRRREERKHKQEEAAEKKRLFQEAQKREEQEAAAKETEGKSEMEEEAKEQGEEMQIQQVSLDDDEGNKIDTKSKEDVSPAKEEPVVKKKKILPPLPGGGMKREKTVVEKAADISEKKKQETISMLMREQTSLAMKISNEQSRQEELVRRLRDKRRKKMEARESEAAALIGLGQRQKTMVEEKKKDERQRQIGQIRDRVNRIKRERTMVPTDKENETASSPVPEETS